MSLTLSRALLAMAVLVGTPFVYAQVFMLLEDSPGVSAEAALLWADVLAALLLALAWIAIWARTVRWTTARVVRTGLATVLSVLAALLVYALNAAVTGYDEPGIILAGVCWAALWIGATAIIWRESAQERAMRTGAPDGMVLGCPRCGYNLRGLHEARCPECGTQYTLDALFATLIEKREGLDAG